MNQLCGNETVSNLLAMVLFQDEQKCSWIAKVWNISP